MNPSCLVVGSQLVDGLLERVAAVAEVVREVHVVQGELEVALVCKNKPV